jgi:Recombinase zinc beta ribbon domain/Recombinase
MSEFELLTMRNRLQRGRLHKAERGELFVSVPLGYLKLSSGEVVIEPDEQARAVTQLIFDTFDELGTVYGVLHYLVQNNIALGVRLRYGPRRGELEWRRPTLSTLFGVLHHPIYAGAYAFGHRRTDRERPAGGRGQPTRHDMPRDQWKVLLRDRLPAYITWERYVANQERLRRNRSTADSSGVSRTGSALLSGLLVCGTCGRCFQPQYRHAGHPFYNCSRHLQEARQQTCHGLSAAVIDELVVGQVHKALEPAALVLSLRAIEDSRHERERLNRHWKKELERARYEAARAERQYHTVEPENRLVARTLEQRWEEVLKELRRVEDAYDAFLRARPLQLSGDERDRIAELSRDIPALWHAAGTTNADRKDIIRCLVQKVVAHVRRDSQYVDVTIHWQGGFTSQHELVRPVHSYQCLREADRLRERITALKHKGWTAAAIAAKLNGEGFSTPRRCNPFTETQVWQLLFRYGLTRKPDSERLGSHERRLGELAKELGVSRQKLRDWVAKGWAHGRQTPTQGLWIVWADADEMHRLRQLKARSKLGMVGYPIELTTPKNKPAS